MDYIVVCSMSIATILTSPMRVLLDLPDDLLRRLQQLVAEKGYGSIAQVAAVALENQLSIELPLSPNSDTSRVDVQAALTDNTSSLPLALGKVSSPVTLDPAETVLASPDSGWLWGMVNRVLPIKVAARSLLLDTTDGLARLEGARAYSASRAHKLAQWILAKYGDTKPGRDDTLLTGLPTREPLYKAKERFADFFFGRVDGAGKAWGALFELGLAGVVKNGEKYETALTSGGVQFARLSNPVLDEGNLERALSDEEIDWYVTNIAMQVARERACLETLLGALLDRDLSTDDLTVICQRSLPQGLSEASVQTMKTGALGRLDDLQLISRTRRGRTVSHSATSRGEAMLAVLRRPPALATKSEVKRARGGKK